MNALNTFQHNSLITGVGLAAEVRSSLPERRAFVVTGSYINAYGKSMRPSKVLNKEEKTLRFWIRKYEVNVIDIDKDIDYEDTFEMTYIKDIESIEALEKELAKLLEDFSLLKPSWYVDNPLP